MAHRKGGERSEILLALREQILNLRNVIEFDISLDDAVLLDAHRIIDVFAPAVKTGDGEAVLGLLLDLLAVLVRDGLGLLRSIHVKARDGAVEIDLAGCSLHVPRYLDFGCPCGAERLLVIEI